MTKRRKRAVVPGLAALAVVAVLLSAYTGATQQPDTVIKDRGSWGYSAASSPQGRSPVQPIAFPHPTHVQTLGMNCLYCHFSANKSPDPGMPAVGTCMGCHLVIGPNRPAMNGRPARKSEGIATLQKYWTQKKPVPWVRIHHVPDYVNFAHMPHINAGVTCQTCHGQVQQMNRVYQYASLNMGWCINCHVGNVNPKWKARYDCSVCHY
ncbi:MAG TPA: cytochrome c3 family protein [Gemmatimonadaceae bacterium]